MSQLPCELRPVVAALNWCTEVSARNSKSELSAGNSKSKFQSEIQNSQCILACGTISKGSSQVMALCKDWFEP